MGTESDTLKIHIVHSNKGGSGKTAFSLMKAIGCSMAENGYTLYLDADFKGTSVKKLIYGENASAFKIVANECYLDNYEIDGKRSGIDGAVKLIFREEYNSKTINDFLNCDEENFRNICVKGGILQRQNGRAGEEFSDAEDTNPKLISILDFIFASPDAEDKEAFYYAAEDGQLPALSAHIFRKRFRKLLEQILEYTGISGRGKRYYGNLVIDMPPGEDEYSKIILSEILRLKKKSISYYAMVTTDLGHIYTEGQTLYSQMKQKSSEMSYDKFVIVFNEMQKDEFKRYLNGANDKTIKNQIKIMLDSAGKNPSNLDRLYYVMNTFNQSYYEFCRLNDQDDFDVASWEVMSYIENGGGRS